MGRRSTALICLALTIAMLLCLPGGFLYLREQGTSRVDESLRRKKTELITVWLLRDDTDSLKTVKRLIAAFEKENKELRVLLRKADASELTDGCVPPDALLFSLGELTEPERWLIPLDGARGCREDAALCGILGGARYALPLWYSPYVLAVGQSPDNTARPTSRAYLPLLPADTPAPTPQADADDLWRTLIETRALQAPEGIAAVQLLCSCPPELRAGMARSLTNKGTAKCLRYRDAAALTDTRIVPLLPAAADDALLMGLCKAGKAERLLDYLLSDATQSSLAGDGLFATREGASLPAGGLLHDRAMILPNAFARTREALDALCAQALKAGGDPVPMLMRLR